MRVRAYGLRYARQSPVTHGPSRPQSVRNKGSLHSGIGLVCSRDGRPVLAGGTSQEELAEQNAKLPEDWRMAFRIGVNLDDLIAEGHTIRGDG